MKRIILITAICLFAGVFTMAQELKCSVNVNSQQVSGTDKEIFTNMQKDIYEFMNNQNWTGYTFNVEERIECTLQFTISERVSSDEFSGTLNIVIQRPIFNTSYDSPMINWVDSDVHFYYTENEPIEFVENSYTTELSAILGFYANFILGMDFDSFSKFGGTPYFEKAMDIANMAQSNGEAGWEYAEEKNRYWLAENYTNNSYAAIREASYIYHRLGMDKMQDNADMGRSQVVEAIELLKVVNEQRPNLFILKLFTEAKSDEMISIFKQGTSMEKTTVVEILKTLDPTHSSDYDKIVQDD